jgi:hypothetical protein
MKNIDFDNADLGIAGFAVAAVGLTVAVAFGGITEATFVSLFPTCLVGIGSLANPKKVVGRITKQ